MLPERKERAPRQRYPYFAVVGGVGVGKSKLTDLLASSFGLTGFREEFIDNPFLQRFYTEDPREHAFNCQMCFLTEEAKQMRPLVPKLQTTSVVHDQYIEGDAFFENILARKFGFISKDQDATYRSCYRAFMRGNFLPKADIYIGVTSSEETAVERIKDRKREMELIMLDRYPDYFPTITRSFDTWFKLLARRHPVIIINTDTHDFVNSDRARAHVLDEIRAWSGYHLSSPYRLNLRGREGARLVLPDFLKSRPGTYFDITPGLSTDSKMLQRR